MNSFLLLRIYFLVLLVKVFKCIYIYLLIFIKNQSFLVLEKTITLLSDPNFINENLLWLLDEQTLSEPDKAYSYAETYEDFIKIINKCDDINTLYQIRYI